MDSGLTGLGGRLVTGGSRVSVAGLDVVVARESSGAAMTGTVARAASCAGVETVSPLVAADVCVSAADGAGGRRDAGDRRGPAERALGAM